MINDQSSRNASIGGQQKKSVRLSVDVESRNEPIFLSERASQIKQASSKTVREECVSLEVKTPKQIANTNVRIRESRRKAVVNFKPPDF